MKAFVVLLTVAFVLVAHVVAVAGPGDPRLVNGVLEWPRTVTNEPFLVVRGDDGVLYYVGISAARRDGPLAAGARVAVLGLEGRAANEITALGVGAGETTETALAHLQGARPAPAASAPVVVTPPGAVPATAPPGTPTPSAAAARAGAPAGGPPAPRGTRPGRRPAAGGRPRARAARHAAAGRRRRSGGCARRDGPGARLAVRTAGDDRHAALAKRGPRAGRRAARAAGRPARNDCHARRRRAEHGNPRARAAGRGCSLGRRRGAHGGEAAGRGGDRRASHAARVRGRRSPLDRDQRHRRVAGRPHACHSLGRRPRGRGRFEPRPEPGAAGDAGP